MFNVNWGKVIVKYKKENLLIVVDYVIKILFPICNLLEALMANLC